MRAEGSIEKRATRGVAVLWKGEHKGRKGVSTNSTRDGRCSTTFALSKSIVHAAPGEKHDDAPMDVDSHNPEQERAGIPSPTFLPTRCPTPPDLLVLPSFGQ